MVLARQWARRFLSLSPYFAIPFLSAVTPFLALPAITSTYGVSGWATVAIAQAAGTFAGLLVELGWGVTGPQRVARMNGKTAASLYRQSVTTKLTVFCVIASPIFFVAHALSPEFKAAGGAIAVATAALGLSPAWFYIGKGRPLRILLFESIPRLIAVAIAAVAIYRNAPIVTYAVGLVASVLVSLLLTAVAGGLGWFQWAGSLAAMRSQSIVIVGRVIGGAYTSLPTVLLSFVHPNSVPLYAAADRLARMGLSVLAGVPARLQSWIGHESAIVRSQRAKKSLGYNAALGLFSGLTFFVLAPWATRILLSDSVSMNYATSALGGLLVLAVCTSRGFGLSMVSAGRANQLTFAIVLSALVSIPLIFTLGAEFGANGGLLAVLMAEITGIAIQAIIVIRRWTALRHWHGFALT